MSTSDAALPFLISATGNDDEIAALIESWRYRGEPTDWSAIVGHEHQIARCRELVEKLRRTPQELERLRLRVGAGLVITGPAGVGKSLMARALATAAGREVIVAPTAEMTPSLITRLYAQLAKMEPVVVILDEAEAIIGHGGSHATDDDAQRAFLAALDGVLRPQRGPITLALTTASEWELSAAAIRPGRLAPRLALEAPTAAERLVLLERAVAGVPTAGRIDLFPLVERTAGWSGAELTVAIEEACSRSLLDGTDALRQDLLLEVVAERFVVEDERPQHQITRASALHEAGHAIYGELTWPGQVAVVELTYDGGHTRLSEQIETGCHDAQQLRRLAAMSLAGMSAEELLLGPEARSTGGGHDRSQTSSFLLQRAAVMRPYDVDVLEAGSDSDRGSERMRAGLHATLEAEAAGLYAEVLATLLPRRHALERFAASLLAADRYVLSGPELATALAKALASPDGTGTFASLADGHRGERMRR